MLAELHSDCTAAIADATGSFAGGLTASARVARRRGRIKAATLHRLERLDVAVAFLRHASKPRSVFCLQQLLAELGESGGAAASGCIPAEEGDIGVAIPIKALPTGSGV